MSKNDETIDIDERIRRMELRLEIIEETSAVLRGVADTLRAAQFDLVFSDPWQGLPDALTDGVTFQVNESLVGVDSDLCLGPNSTVEVRGTADPAVEALHNLEERVLDSLGILSASRRFCEDTSGEPGEVEGNDLERCLVRCLERGVIKEFN